MSHHSGGCLCGKHRYKVSSIPISQGVCYCRHCQRAGGACGSPLLVLAHAALRGLGDDLSFYEARSERGSVVRRYFCGNCGSPIFSQISDVPEIVTLKAATLDDMNDFEPQYLVWTQSAAASTTFQPGVPQFSGNAPLEILLNLL